MNIKRSIEALYLLLMITLRLIMLAMIAATLAIGILVVGMTSLVSLIVVVLALLPVLLFHEETRQKLLRAYSFLLGPIPEWLGRSFILPSLLFGPVALIDRGIAASSGAYHPSAIDYILEVFTLCITGGAAVSLSVFTFLV